MNLLPPEFEYRRVDVEGVTINCAIAGSGPPVLMLHGYPQNHLMWRDVAPALAEDHTVVVADLRGYGDSDKPAPDAAGEVYAKRSMAADQAGLMRQLGFGRFQLVGHDRGARVSRHRRPRRGPARRPLPPRGSTGPDHRRPPRLPSMRGMTAVDLAHDDVGDGPAAVLIHGHPFNRTMWAPQVAALRDRFRVVVPDLRGYGESPVTPGTVPMAQLAADVSHLLDRKGIASAALAGLSMGGLVVMELAAARPERWWAYAFIATTAQRVTAEEAQARRASARTMAEQGMAPVAEQMSARLFGPEPDPELTAMIMAMMLATNPAGAAAAVRGRAERPDYQPVLKSLGAPALVCTGDHDSYSTAEVTSELAGCLPDPEVVLLGGAGHLPNLERPDEFNEHLLRFLTRVLP
jgi:pimeloyl-ACP methyl ester carboxylesterase